MSLVKQNRNKHSWNKECLVFVPFYRKYPQWLEPWVSIRSNLVVFPNLGPWETFSCLTSLTFCCVVHKYKYSIDIICYLPLEGLINSLLLQSEHFSFLTLPALSFFFIHWFQMDNLSTLLSVKFTGDLQFPNDDW